MQDSTYKYYEVIMIDIAHKVVRMVRSALHYCNFCIFISSPAHAHSLSV